MRNRLRFVGYCFIAFHGFFALGCKTVSPESALNVRVIDAETKRPLPDARVILSDAQPNDVAMEIEGVTEKSGIARIGKLPSERDFVMSVSAGRYLPTVTSVYEATRAGAKSAAAVPTAIENQRTVQVELFAEPRPTIELVIPEGFRGPIQADFQIDPTQISSSQMRQFRFDVNKEGHVVIGGPPILKCVLPADFVALNPDGTPMPPAKLPFDVGLRIVAKSEAADYFVIGTDLDRSMARKRVDQMLATQGRTENRGGFRRGIESGGSTR